MDKLKTRTIAIVAIWLAATVPFMSSLPGGWVYDDHPQILQNHLIQQPAMAARALLGDVWAFKQADENAASNYWRPTFVAWLLLNERLFGIDDPLPWRLAVLALHALTCLLAFQLLQSVGLRVPVALAIAVLFAVHPTHVESVAWISGATDPLLALFMFSTMCCVVGAQRGGRWRGYWWFGAIGACALALGCKEVALVFPLLVPLLIACSSPQTSLRHRLTAGVPFALVALIYLVARAGILSRFQLQIPDELSFAELLANVPRLLHFYLGQAVWPAPLSPNYPLRAWRLAEPWATPLNALGVAWMLALTVAAWKLRRHPLGLFGLALFTLPLLPAFNLNAFHPEQIVHDRYLYLPVLGLLIALAALFPRRVSAEPQSSEPEPRSRVGWIVACISLLWGGMAWSYARVWSDELSLWQRAVETDSRSASSRAALAHVLWQRDLHAEAKLSVQRAIDLRPDTAAYLLRADIAVAEGDMAAAEADLRKVLASFPSFPPAIERLALLLQRGQRYQEAERLLMQFRDAAPQFACRTDVGLAILRYLAGDKAATRTLLQSAADQAQRDHSGACLAAHFHLAQLSFEEDDKPAAQRQLGRYLDTTGSLRDTTSQSLRVPAQRLMAQLSAGE